MNETIDLNADLGEGCDGDADLMSVITSCNIACGGHAGDAASMREALRLAKANGVSAGAHPSFPDRENFGRTRSSLSGKDLEQALIEQVETLRELAAEMSVSLAHLKPHGALYNMAAIDAELAQSIVTVLEETLPDAKLVGPPASELQYAAQSRGVGFTAEGFADRAYEADGQLRDRTKPGAVIHDADAQAEQALRIATQQNVTTHQGDVISLPVATICVHGDTPESVAAARKIQAALENEGLKLCAPT